MNDTLVKLSDKFDREGKTDLADAVDNVLLSTAARPKAPLKSLDENVKKDLLKFIHKVSANLDDSMNSLEEFFRRLRYFDIGEAVKDLRLDKALKELLKTKECVDNAGKAMYALTYGKHPSKADLSQLAEDFGSEKTDHGGPLEFFESQRKDKDPTPEKDLAGFDEDEMLGSFLAGPDGVKEIEEVDPDPSDALEEDEELSEEELETFMKSLYEPEDDSEEEFEDESEELNNVD